MKKKLLLGILAVCLTFIGLNGVKADGPAVSYDEYGNGSTIMFNSTTKKECYNLQDPSCKEYTVLEDDGFEDEYIKLKKGEEEFELSKRDIAQGFVLTTTKPVKEFYLPGEHGSNDIDFESIDGFQGIQFYRSMYLSTNETQIWEYDVNNGKYINLVTIGNNALYFDDNEILNIPRNVTITANAIEAVKGIVNNGIIKTGALTAANISGNGNIKISYAATPQGAPFGSFERLFFGGISGVKLDIIGVQIKEGLLVGKLGRISDTTKEDAQKRINQLNSVKGSSLKGYKFMLHEASVSDEDKLAVGVEGADIKYYVGVLAKETASEKLANAASNVKKAVKNPKTGDTLFAILGAITLAGAGFIVTIKKAKQK